MDIVERLRRNAPEATKPRVAAIMDEAAATIETQAATIEALRAELAGRDAEIAAWLRDTIKATKLDVADGLWVGISEDAEGFINTLRIIIEGIETRAYAKENSE